MKVAILGSTGMLGSMVRRVLAERREYELVVIDRLAFPEHDCALADSATLAFLLASCQYAINCIGQIKPRIDEGSAKSVEQAVRVNSMFPHTLAAAAERIGCQVLQIATDCVYSGATGGYTESSPHDALDVYGKTKSLGEVCSPNVHHLRCSIIGPELEGRPKDSLLEWFLGQPQGATVDGYTNHQWNGITTLAFAKICHGIMRDSIKLPQLQHIVPMNSVAKDKLLRHFAYYYKRLDIRVVAIQAPVGVDRTLTTIKAEMNAELWRAAGYSSIPDVAQLVHGLAAYK